MHACIRAFVNAFQMDIQMMQLKCFLIATPFMIAAYVSLYSSHLFSPETVVENMPARIAFSMVDQVVVVGPTYGRLHMLDTTSKANDEYVHVCALLNVKTKAEVLDVECGAIKLTAFILDVMHTMAFFIIF